MMQQQELRDHERYLCLMEGLVRRDPAGLGVRSQLAGIARGADVKAHYSVVLDARVLLDCDALVGHVVLRFPEVALELLSQALAGELERLVEQGTGAFRDGSCKRNVHARVEWLPGANRKPNVSSLRAVDVNGLVQLSGTVTKSSAVRVLEAVRVFQCTNDACSGRVKCFASLHEAGNLCEKPSGPCPSCRRCSTYSELKMEATCYDYQELSVQEQVHKLGMGAMPRSMCVVLLHDLVDRCKAGDCVVLTGVPINRWNATHLEERCNLETVLHANTVRVVNAASQGVQLTDDAAAAFEAFWAASGERPVAARDRILRGVCPQLFGSYVAKLALCLSLIGCPAFRDAHGSVVRGDSHLLLVGDPGTGKSQLLRFAAKLAARAVQTTGTGTTGAGLTCSVQRDGHETVLEAGALVLADRGVCCIDEFACIQAGDRATMHEAMEQQTLSVAKAGMVCKLNTRTTVVAACNPKGSFDASESLSTNTGIEPPLLSRFDLVLVMLDSCDAEWDKSVSGFILQSQLVAAPAPAPAPAPQQGCVGQGDCEWDIETLRAYVAFVKRIDPKLTPEAGLVISTYYKAQRARPDCDAARTTLRLLEALLRLAKAHARLMARDQVFILDAVVSVQLVELSLACTLGDRPPDLSRQQAPAEPDQHMHFLTEEILHELGLAHLCETARRQMATKRPVGACAAVTSARSEDYRDDQNQNQNHDDDANMPLATLEKEEKPTNCTRQAQHALHFPSQSQFQQTAQNKNHFSQHLSSDDDDDDDDF